MKILISLIENLKMRSKTSCLLLTCEYVVKLKKFQVVTGMPLLWLKLEFWLWAQHVPGLRHLSKGLNLLINPNLSQFLVHLNSPSLQSLISFKAIWQACCIVSMMCLSEYLAVAVQYIDYNFSVKICY